MAAWPGGGGASLDGKRAVLSALTETPYPYPAGPPSAPALPDLPWLQYESLPDFSTGLADLDLYRVEQTLMANGYAPIYVDVTRGDLDIPVAVGIPPGERPGNQSEWLGDYLLDGYPGAVHADGVGAIVSTIKESPDPVTIVAIGGVPNIAAALERDPTIVNNSRFVGMHGSIRIGYGNAAEPAAEANVKAD